MRVMACMARSPALLPRTPDRMQGVACAHPAYHGSPPTQHKVCRGTRAHRRQAMPGAVASCPSHRPFVHSVL